MDETAIYSDLTEIFRDIFMRDDIVLKAETTAADIDGWDSYKQVEIIISIEERYGIKFHTRELDQLACVGDLARAIASKAH